MGAKEHPQNNKHTIKTIKIINETSHAQNHWNVSWISTSCGLNCEIVESKYLQTTFHFCPMLAQLSQNQNVPMKHFHTDMLQCVAGCFHEFGKLRGKEQNHGNKYKGKTASARSVDGKQKN